VDKVMVSMGEIKKGKNGWQVFEDLIASHS
jgi:hypothetical protein